MTTWLDEIGDPDMEPYPIVRDLRARLDEIGASAEWLPETSGRWVLLQRSSRWKAGTGYGDDYSAYYEQHLKLREAVETEHGEIEYRKPPLALHIEIMPQYPDLVYKSGDDLELPHGEGSRILAWTTWAESGEQIEQRAYDAVRAAFGVDVLDLDDRVHDSRRLAKAEAHVRHHIDKKGAVVETVEDSKDLIDYGGEAEIDAHARRQREGWLECRVESDRWDRLGFEEQPFSTELKVYQHGSWTQIPDDDARHHPKLEASFAGVERGKLPHVEDWDDVLGHLRRVVSTHLEWAGVARTDMIEDDFFDGPLAPEWTFEKPTGRKEMLRERYESRETTVFREAASKLTTAVHDILSVIHEEKGAHYDLLAEKTGLARSTVRYHVARLAESGVLIRKGNPVLVVFDSWELRDRAKDALKKARPERTREDRERDAERRVADRNDDRECDDEPASAEERAASDGDESDDSLGFAYLDHIRAGPRDLVDEFDDGRLSGEDVRVRLDALREGLR
jgi:DNA-binding MarR family transcriptional regulator